MKLVGLNGFGRIGKTVFLQLLDSEKYVISVINAPSLDIQKIESYLKNDSVHKYPRNFVVEVSGENEFSINGHKVTVLRERDASKLGWKTHGIDCVIDATGAYLTKEKASTHNVSSVIMTAPAKDDTPLFVYGANHTTYAGENIVSGASCTTNCITPVLALLNEKFNIKSANFTTIHAATASQQVVDTANSKNRTCRSIFNNIIPHTTGASSSIAKVLPDLSGKVAGTSVRVPVNNVSLVDLNVELEDEEDMDNIFREMDACPYIHVCNESLVSSDYISTTCPSIVDRHACMKIDDKNFKLMVWYDNEWSYSAQIINLLDTMQSYSVSNHHYIDNMQFGGKNVVIRLDLNVPVSNGKVTSEYRIESVMPTLNKILADVPRRLVIMSHRGRPKGPDTTQSLRLLVPILEKYIGKEVHFLAEGLSFHTADALQKVEYSDTETHVCLLENLRFHTEETSYHECDASNEAVTAIRNLGDVYINDAFGCAHRDHLSINGVLCKEMGYGYLIHKEVQALNVITQNPYDQRILAIIGGAKIDDKLTLIRNLSKKVDTIYICGGNINSIKKNNMCDYLKEVRGNRATIVLMSDGLVNTSIDKSHAAPCPMLKEYDELEENEYFYDMGARSTIALQKLIDSHSIVFWNGTIGVVEDDQYRYGSEMCVNMLNNSMRMNPRQRVIIGGGDTAGFVKNFTNCFTHISTGGGASMEYITFDRLVGLKHFDMY